MGNSQSQHGSPQNRLSKPKTNSNSPRLPPKTDPPVSVSSRYTDLSARDRRMLKAHLTAPLGIDTASSFDWDAEDGLDELATRMHSRLSGLSTNNSVAPLGSARNSTSKIGDLPASQPSLVSNSPRLDLTTTTRILYEIKKNSSREDLAALNEALKPSPSPTPAPELKRRVSLMNRSSLSLIRRRSLITPTGLASRDSSTEPTRRWSSWRKPQLDPEEEAKWNREMMRGSPFTRIAALDLADRTDSPTPRAQTPGDMEYTHLGSLRLGSLIVTNGAASPAPSAIISHGKSNHNMAQADDYFTAPEDTPVRKMSRKWRHSRSKSTVPSKTPALQRNLSISEEIRRAKTLSRCDSPLKGETQHFYYDDDLEVENFKLRLRVINKSVDTLTKAYMTETPNSPFVEPDVKSPEESYSHSQSQEYQHQPAEPHDGGFIDSTLVSGESFREQALRILDGTIFTDPDTSLELTKSPSTPIRATASSCRNTKESMGRRPSTRNADSGYSSGESFRTTSREATRESYTSSTTKKSSVVADLLKTRDDAASLYTFEQMVSLSATKKPLPPLPMEKSLDARPANLHIPEHVANHIQSSPSVNSPGTPVSVASMFTVDSKASSVPKRLQRRRPSQPELPIVQSCQRIQDGTIPSIPVGVKAQFVRRLSESPDMECLTKTYLSKEHIKASESTVDSPTTISLEFSAPSIVPESRGRHHTRSHTERPSTQRPRSLRRSLSLFRSKSSVGKKGQQEEECRREDGGGATAAVDLGTAAQMLGRSQYDVAMLAPKPTVTLTAHAHQLGSTLPRAKSMVQMDSQTAAEFARMRSMDRALGPPEMLQRPQSYHDRHLKTEDAKYSRRSCHNMPISHVPVSTDSISPVCNASPWVEEAGFTMADTNPSHNIRARSTGRGVVVSQLVDKFDRHGQKIPQSEQQSDWEPHAQFWSQRRTPIGEGPYQEAADFPTISSPPLPRASSQPPEETMAYDHYRGRLDYRYERGYGIGGSAGTRQLHSYSYASRKSMHYGNQYAVDFSDVPVFVQRC